MKEIVLNHPLIQHKLSILRDKKTGTKEFREIIGELAMFLCYEATKDATLQEVEIKRRPICFFTNLASGNWYARWSYSCHSKC